MGRALEAIRTRDVATLFAFFGLDADLGLVEAYRGAIESRFRAEVQAIIRHCQGLRERERFTVCREALRLAYESAVARGHALMA
jgi:hypothetical protein